MPYSATDDTDNDDSPDDSDDDYIEDTENGWEFLQAAIAGDLELVEEYLQDGVSPNVKYDDGSTPLHYASEFGYEAVATLLLERGAKVNTKDDDGSTPLHRASENGYEAVATLLLEKGAEVNAKDVFGGWTPLHLASMCGYEAIAALLVERGAKVNAKDDDGSTPLHRASKYGNMAVATLLLEKGADVNAKSNIGSTPLHLASSTGNEAVATLMLKKGADVNAKDNDGHNPLHWAGLNKHEVAATLLLEWGASEASNAASIPQHDVTNEIGAITMLMLKNTIEESNTQIRHFESFQNSNKEAFAAPMLNEEEEVISSMTEPSFLPTLTLVLTNCRMARQLLHIQTSTPTAAINKSFKVFLHEMKKDLSDSAERHDPASPVHHLALLLEYCRAAINLHQIQTLTPTQAISYSLQAILNDMENKLSQLAPESIVATRIAAQTMAEADTDAAKSASDRV